MLVGPGFFASPRTHPRFCEKYGRETKGGEKEEVPVEREEQGGARDGASLQVRLASPAPLGLR